MKCCPNADLSDLRLGDGVIDLLKSGRVVRPAFQMAVEDDLIRKNPLEFQLAR